MPINLPNVYEWAAFALRLDGFLGWLSWVTLAMLALVAVKAVATFSGVAWQLMRFFFARLFWSTLEGYWAFITVFLLFGTVGFSFRHELSDTLADWIDPIVYAGQIDYMPATMEAHACRQRLNDLNGVGVGEYVASRTAKLADTLGVPEQWLYYMAYAECGLKPFTVRKDGVAAGWIQFTKNGLEGSGVSLSRVKRACAEMDAPFLMDLTDWYMLSRVNGKALPRPVDVYLAVFAPAAIGKPDDWVLYAENRDGAKYTKNSGLDGWSVENGQIKNRYKYKDGAITVAELALYMEQKHITLLTK